MAINLRTLLGFDSVYPSQTHPIFTDRFWSFVETAGLRRFKSGEHVNLSNAILVGIAPAYCLYDVALAGCLIRTKAVVDEVNLYLFDTVEVRDVKDIERFLPGFGEAFQTPMVGIYKDGVLIRKGSGFHGRRLLESTLSIDCSEEIQAVLSRNLRSGDPR